MDFDARYRDKREGEGLEDQKPYEKAVEALLKVPSIESHKHSVT